MKFLIVIACALAAASASHLVAPLAYHAQHLPIIGANGVPVDTAEVQHAKAAHFAHKVEAHARNGDYAVYAHHTPAVYAAHHVAAPVVSAYAAHHVAAPVVSTYAAHHVAAPAVSAYAAHHVASPYYAHPYAYSAYAHAYPTTAVHPTSVNGVPLETPEVVAAKANHFAAHAEALHRHRRGVVGYSAVASPVAYTSAVAAPVAYSSYAHAPVVANTYAAHHGYVNHPYSYTPFARYFY